MTATTPSDGERFDRAIARCPDCAMQFGWWSRGGEPGPGYTSDKLQFSSQDKLFRATYTQARFDPAYETNFRAVEYRATLPRQLAEQLAAALRHERPFQTPLESEQRGNLADGIKESITLALDGERYAKNMVESTDTELVQLKIARNQLVEYLIKHGAPTDLNALRPTPARPGPTGPTPPPKQFH